jgi:hypothetical protein
MKKLLIIFLILITLPLNATNHYVATTGNDGNAGTIGSPWRTWQHAFDNTLPGEITYIRGGTYYEPVEGGIFENNIDGTAGNLISIEAYPGEVPVLDLSTFSPTGDNIGIYMYLCDYWHLKGLNVTGVQQYGTNDAGIRFYRCNHNIIEQCNTYYNESMGIEIIGLGGDATDNLVHNCDSYYNDDPAGHNNGNGMQVTYVTSASTNTFRACRAWSNAWGEGFGTWEVNGLAVYDSCWSWNNTGGSGDGNGFELGLTTANTGGITRRLLTNCIAYGNQAAGFCQNDANVIMELYNNVAYLNGSGFSFNNNYTNTRTFRNNINYNSGYDAFLGTIVHDHNSWDDGVTVSNADFLSVDYTQMAGVRVNGHLPIITFLHPVSTSDLVDAGVDVGIDYEDSAPDIGAFEYVPQVPAVDPVVIKVVGVSFGTSNATIGCNVTDDGGGTVSDRGVCWGTGANPVITDSHNHNGTGVGAFNSYITGLTANTTYHVRGFATNEAGTAYTADSQFTTTSDAGLSGDPVFVNGKILMVGNKVVIK